MLARGAKFQESLKWRFFDILKLDNYLENASEFAIKQFLTFSNSRSQFVKFGFPASLGASPLASADEFSSNSQGFLYSTKNSRSRRSGFEPILLRKFFFSEKFPYKAAI